MTWFKIDDSLHSHPKQTACSLAAVGLWTVAGSWSSDHLTDGFVPDHQIPLLSRGSTKLADELVAVGMWRRVKGGYRFHEWHEDADGTKRNPTAKEVKEERAKKAEAGRKGGLASAKARRKGSSKNEARASTVLGDSFNPRPDPTLEGSKEPSMPHNELRGRKKGTRLPDNFTVTDEMQQWVREKTPHIQAWVEHEKFVDYWTAKSGRDATKVDWVATWRNWMRNAEERAGRTNGQRPDTAAAHGSWTPPEPPEHIANDLEAYRKWYADQVANHRGSNQ